MQKVKWQCRVSPTLGKGFAGTPNKAWGTLPYKDKNKPVVFFGLYGLPDLIAFRNHNGKKAILWAGTDVTYLINGYWLDTRGNYRVDPKQVAGFLSHYPNYCENDLEWNELLSVGIDAKVVPSYLGSLNVKPCFKHSDKPKGYISVSGNDFNAYGWDKLDDLSHSLPELTIYCYGNTKPYRFESPNIIVRGRVPQSKMNKEIKKMQYGIRLNKHDGFSEVLAKAILMEQNVISFIGYPFLEMDRKKARQWLLKNVNKYPWNTQQ